MMDPSGWTRLSPHPIATTFLLVAFIGIGHILTPKAWSSPAEPLTLSQAIQLALENNPEFQAARQRREVARGRMVNAHYLNPFNPAIRGRGFSRQFNQGGRGNQFQLMLSQEVEVAGQRGLRIEEARRNLSKIEAQVLNQRRIVKGSVRRVFYTALVSKKRLRLLEKIEELNRRVRDAAVERFRAGATPIMEANLAKIRLGQSRKDSLSAHAAYQSALAQLKRILGLPADRTIKPVGKLTRSAEPVKLPALITMAIEQRPDLKAAKSEIDRIQAETQLTRRLIVPNPTFQGIYQTEAESEAGADRIIGAGVSIPLPIFDDNQAELVSLAGEERQGRHLADATVRTIERDVTQAFQAYEAARQTLDVFETDVLKPVDQNFTFIEIAYREGKINLLQFIVVQNDLVRAQLSYLDTLGQFRTAEANLKLAVGGPF